MVEKDCLILSDLKNSFAVFEIKENWENKPGEVNLERKFECFEKDTVTAINCVKIIKEPGQYVETDSAVDEKSYKIIVVAGSNNCIQLY